MNKLYSITELSKMLKIQTQRPNESCIRFLKQIEEKKQIMVLEKIGKKFFVSEHVLRNVLPQLFENDQVTELNMTRLKETVQILLNKVNTLSVRVQQLESQVKELS